MDRLLKWASVIIAIIALIASGSALFVHRTAQAEDAPQRERLVKLETQQTETERRFEDIQRRLERIENKIDSLRK